MAAANSSDTGKSFQYLLRKLIDEVLHLLVQSFGLPP
jgi:hypothetical protein